MLIKSFLLRLFLILSVVAAYPAFVLGYTWAHVAQMNLPGGKHGPLDAYRHTLASAVVAYTLTPRAVHWTTRVMERGGGPSHFMDRHNNHIGAMIGANAKSFAQLEPTVRQQVLQGTIHSTDPKQTTWLPPERWHSGWLW